MKKRMVMLMFIAVNALQLAARPPHVYVKVRPNVPKVMVVRPACPGPKHIWIDGDWVWNPKMNQYVWVEGKWVLPKESAVWIPGQWKNTRFGWVWVPGYWR